MRYKIGSIFSAILMLILISIPVQGEEPSHQKAMANSINSFSFELLKILSQGNSDQNIFISPLSISYALGMVYLGADGTTREAIHRTLALGELEWEEVAAGYRALMDTLLQADDSITMNIANSLWINSGFSIKDQFLKECGENFGSTAERLNFNSPDAANHMNDWASKNTNGKIPYIIEPPIDPLTMMIIMNAVYFKGSWATQFEEILTKDDSFFLGNGNTTACRMMNRQDQMAAFFSKDYRAVSLPYGKGAIQMLVILPNEGLTPDDIIAGLDYQNWRSLLSGLHPCQVELFLPKLKLNYGAALGDILKIMGMAEAFSKEANFKRISADTLYISEVLHKTFVQIDEEGTEAAAVTAVIMMTTESCEPMLENLTLRIDRPFVFAIYHRPSGAIIFAGKIENPVWED